MFGQPIRMLAPAKPFDHTFVVPEPLLQEGASLQRTRAGHVTLTAQRAPHAEPQAASNPEARPAPQTPPAPKAAPAAQRSPALRSGKLAAAMAAVQSPAAVQYQPTPEPAPVNDPNVLVAEDLGDVEDAVPVLEGESMPGGEGAAAEGAASSGYMFRGEWREY